MNFACQLRTHQGGLILLKSEVYFYDGGWDGRFNRICLLLRSASEAKCVVGRSASVVPWGDACVVYVLVDSTPMYIWVHDDDVELL